MRESIRYLTNKIKLVSDFFNSQDVFLVFTIILVASASFGLGRLSKITENDFPLQINNIASVSEVIESNEVKGNYVVSKNGSKYHLPWCSGAQRISETNKIWFETKEEAENKGYTPAANCKGI
ncbi:hypothetical protein A2442_02900 [Candidatus Campbellbacteria bacterium RIFOXYC2_FULL_35_25]|uniref:Ada DNA repair metal-binding domain-containing protein n=1 Tax=Candidatus Campbellbacteria bacterium RIFOXYC2_FULL_35_25 TaxID=1797582 RepID=A0A1F5EJ16_9BACT|nr:MAG: hypothetical protein A2442_02900 [Candidatus Campbellbacteria bacterium RIFOXYC2_FULL_35_25]